MEFNFTPFHLHQVFLVHHLEIQQMGLLLVVDLG
jgi:hypothetical protein